MYKDPDKQREANRERQRRYKARQKAVISEGVTGGDDALPKGVTSEGVTDKALLKARQEGMTPDIMVSQEVMVIPEQANIPIDKREQVAKRGKDIKVFADLPPDVQQTIDNLSVVDGKIDQTTKANRTAIAINYQHLYPGRFYSTGVA